MKNRVLLSAPLLLFSLLLGGAEWKVQSINGVPRLLRDGKVESNFIFSM